MNLGVPHFELAIRDLVAKYLRPVHLEDGCSDQMINNCETALEIAFPKSLIQYFKTLGNASDINTSFYKTLSPDQVTRVFVGDKEYLIVAQGHQELSHFGILVNKLKEEDPPVYEIVGNSVEMSFSASRSFYVFVIMWQLINQLGKNRATSFISLSTSRKIASIANPVILSRNNTGNLKFYTTEECLILLTTEGKKHLVSMAAIETSSIKNYCSKFKLEISFSNLCPPDHQTAKLD